MNSPGMAEVAIEPYTLRGISVGGIYTSLLVPELRAVFDIGLAPRSFAGAERLFLSHAHADHIGGLVAMLGQRALIKAPQPLQIFLPAAIVEEVSALIEAAGRLQKRPFRVQLQPLQAGDVHPLRSDLSVRAFRTHHPVSSLGYEIVRRVQKLLPELQQLPSQELAAKRAAGETITTVVERSELAYATDTLIDVLDHQPELLRTRSLILECTYLDERKSIAEARAYCHIHLDEIVARAEHFANQRLVLMHFSQHHPPQQVAGLIRRRCPPALAERIVPLVPHGQNWFV